MKKHARKIFLVGALLFFGAFLSACNSSHLISTWKETEAKPSSFKNYLVISVNNNNSKRREWEDAITAALNNHGKKALPSYKYFPKDVPDSAQLSTFIKDKFDAVLMIHKISEENRKYRTPGYSAVYLVPGFRHNFYRSYANIYREVYMPGRIEREKVYQLETNIYEPGEDGRLIWSAVTESRNPRSTQEFSKEVLKLIIPKLIADRILPGQI